MRIKTQFIIIMILFGIILAVLAASAIITHQRLEKATEQENLASDIAQGASELSYLTNDYLIYRESQQLKRWQSRFASLSSQVARLNADKPEQQVLVRNIKANEQRLKQVFESVASAVGGPSPKRSMALDLAFLQVSWSRMAVQSQGLVSDASRLSQLLHQQMDKITGIRTGLMNVMVGLFGVLLLASYMLTYDRILKSIARLQAGTAVIGSGNLDFKIEEKKNDEIGDLSHAFNWMTSSLKEVTASKADLEREMTERKQAEEALRESEERFRSIVENMSEGLMLFDPKCNLIYQNSASKRIHGFSVKEDGRIDHDDLPSIWKAWDDQGSPINFDQWPVSCVFRGERFQNQVLHVLRPETGYEFFASYNGCPIYDSEGRIKLGFITIRDISEQHKAESALHESERRERERAEELAAVFDATPIPIFLAHDPDCLHITSNQAADDLLGNPRGGEASLDAPAEIKPGHFRAFKDGRELSNNELPAQRAARGFPVHDFEFSLVFDDGTARHVVGYGTPLQDHAGRPRGSVLVLADITERKRMEEELRQSEEKWRLLIRYAPSMIYEIDFHRPAFISVNDTMCEFLGYTREELLAMNPFDLLDDEGKALFRERITRKFVREEISDSVEYSSKTKDGREVHGVLNVSFTYKDGKPQGAVVVAHDITERKRAEEALQRRALELQHLSETLDQQVKERTEELSEANKALRQLSIQILSAQEEERKRIAGELHDTLGSYLGGIKFKVEGAMQEIAKTPKAATESLNTIVPVIQEAVEECRRLQQDLRPSMLDDLGLLPTLSWFCRRFQTLYSGIRVDKEVTIEESEVPPPLKIVVFRVTQEAMNNVAKHSKANTVRLYLQRIDGRMELVVEDNGRGIDLEKILDPKSKRLGLGFSSMRERTELSGGSFVIESTKGKGTIIRALWPI